MFCLVLLLVHIVRFFVKFVQRTIRRRQNSALVSTRRSERAERLDELSARILNASPERIESYETILKLQVKELQNLLQSEQLSAAEVLAAYQWRACRVQQRCNCVVEFVTEANRTANQSDESFRSRAKPPLFGLPFCVKATLAVKGYNNSRGLGKELPDLCEEDSSIIAHLKSLGAIPFCRTNFMQLLGFSCSNPIFGQTCNPHNLDRSSGGSSGGGAALVAAGGAVFGLGTDISGSLRIPAHFCGVATLKSTAGTVGFFARDVEFLAELYRWTMSAEYFTRVPQCIPMVYTETRRNRKLKFGYYFNDGIFEAAPSCSRAVEAAVDLLRRQGHSVVPFSIPSPLELARDFSICAFGDNGAGAVEMLCDEPVDRFLTKTYAALQVPAALRHLTAFLVRALWPRLSVLLTGSARDLADVQRAAARLSAYKESFFALWQRQQLDALIGPVMPFAAVSHEWPDRLICTLPYVSTYNALNMPAGVVPFETVTAADDAQLLAAYPERWHGGRLFALKWPVEAMIRQAARDSEGLPVGIQIAALPYREELCLEIMKLLQKYSRAPKL